jgi:hypothetical protein
VGIHASYGAQGVHGGLSSRALDRFLARSFVRLFFCRHMPTIAATTAACATRHERQSTPPVHRTAKTGLSLVNSAYGRMTHRLVLSFDWPIDLSLIELHQ